MPFVQGDKICLKGVPITDDAAHGIVLGRIAGREDVYGVRWSLAPYEVHEISGDLMEHFTEPDPKPERRLGTGVFNNMHIEDEPHSLDFVVVETCEPPTAL